MREIFANHNLENEAGDLKDKEKDTLSEKLNIIMSSGDFGGSRIAPVSSDEVLNQLREANLEIDERVKSEPQENIASTFEGLSFDNEKLRTQTFAILEKEKPVGIIAFAIAPKKWIEEQRYYKKEPDGVSIVDAHEITGEELPDFFIILGRTNVLPSHRGRFAIRIFSAINKAMELIQDVAPEKTWLELIVRGTNEDNKRQESRLFAKNNSGRLIPEEEFPFEISKIGEMNSQSYSSGKMAKLMGLQKVEDIGSSAGLGPVFAKKVK